MLEGNYVILPYQPVTPANSIPTGQECKVYEYMLMTQLCNIAEKYGISRRRACNAFGGDKGKFEVISDRKVRVFENRKYVLVHSVFDYFLEMGVSW